MNILCLGNSTIGRKRAFPALNNSSEIAAIDIASRSNHSDISIRALTKFRKIYGDYEQAITNSDATIVYISTANNTHFQLAKAALENNKHVVVEKPATINTDDTKQLLAIAAEKNLLIAEAVVYCFHPQAELVRSTLANIEQSLDVMELRFLLPSFPTNNYRYERELGGGALWDMGVYACSLPRVLFPTFVKDNIYPEIRRIDCTFADTGVDTRFNFEMVFGDSLTVTGDFGYGAKYQNEAKLVGEDFWIDIERVFAKPDDMVCKVVLGREDSAREMLAPQANIYSEFWKSVFLAVSESKHKNFADLIRYDAICVERLRSAAGQL